MASPLSRAAQVAQNAAGNLRAQRVAELADQVRASQTPQTFRTERGGSIYTINPDGTTTRTKAASLGHDDAGAKESSARTVYVDKPAADILGQMYATGAPKGKETSVTVQPDGTVVMVQWLGRGPNGEPYGRRIERTFKSQPSPSVGMHPLEFMERSRHLGSAITEVTQ